MYSSVFSEKAPFVTTTIKPKYERSFEMLESTLFSETSQIK